MLLNIWADEKIQQHLQGNNFMKMTAWKDITEKFNDQSDEGRNLKEIRSKIGRLREKYDAEAAKKPTGSEGGQSDFEFWDLMHPILSSRHSSNPPKLRDSGIGGDDEFDDESPKRSYFASNTLDSDDETLMDAGNNDAATEEKAVAPKSEG